MSKPIGRTDPARLFFRRLREAMAAREVTQQELARRLGTSPGTVSPWFRARNPSFPNTHILKLPKVLKVNGHWLLTGEGHMDAGPGETFAKGVRHERERVRQMLKKIVP